MPARRKQGLAAGAAVLVLLISAPAIGAVAGSDRSGQPPPGTKGVVAQGHFAPVPKQPAAHVTAHKVTKVAPVPKQPVNRHPVRSTGFKAGAQLRHSKHDKGVKGLKATRDRGKKHLPIQRG
jgi:hypothetical protein